jgi:hypothetical protein
VRDPLPTLTLRVETFQINPPRPGCIAVFNDDKMIGVVTIEQFKECAQRFQEIEVQLRDSPWRPIAEAPRDETSVALFVPSSEHGVVIGFWSENYENWYESESSSHSISSFDNEPTHWMPLPEPPEVEK